ncbi:MAG TPA: serine/threonine-protein kinase, partial [Gemmataceae bacterium]|nr:serine/threonine-protein kinase [Gemmataceae bacterium]
LGGGLLTRVYEARDGTTDTACAVKLLREDWEDQPTAIKLLQREARAGLAIRHTHLVRIVDTHVTRAPYFLVMELVGGESLKRRLQRDYRLDWPTAVWITRQTCEALAAVHRAGFVHGDVKPDNVRLVGDGTAILIDLGFAHRPGENTSFYQQGYVLGTANYLAPELCADIASAGPESDLFSLGVMLYEMLAGRLPFPSATVEEALRTRCSEGPAELRGQAGPLPPALISLVERLLAREPAHRPRAGAVVQQLIALELAALRRRVA